MKKWIKKSLLLICAVTMATFTAVAITGCRKKGGGHEHSWDAGQVTVQATCTTRGEITYTCTSCDQTRTVATPYGHDYEDVVTAPTCVKDGYTTHTCKDCGSVTTDTFVEATGHAFAESTTEATCTVDGYKVRTCDCGYEEREVIERAKGHNTEGAVWAVDGEDVREGSTCTYLRSEKTTCKDCNQPVFKSYTVQKHEYKVEITTPATCTTAGVKTFSCDCGDSFTEDYAVVATAHAWNDGVQDGNLMVYTCTHNAAHTKTEVSLTGETTAKVPQEALTQKDVELKMDNATMKMDDTLREQVGTDVELTAEKLDQTDGAVADAVNAMSEADKARLGDSKIFNFGLTSGGSDVKFNGGKMTVSIPYTLGQGEDPESIAIWYIDATGTVKMYDAVYANGFATFEAEHFSYYTVVRMTPEERCAKYGHSWVETVTAANCIDDGYTLRVCKKCNVSERVNFTKATGHKYEGVVTAATCSERGYTTYTCSNANCGDVYVSNYVAALSHVYVDTVKAPTCTAKGYTTHTCANCHKTTVDNYVDALGHTYKKGKCEVCGSPDPNAITVDNFYLQLINSLQSFKEGAYIEMKDFDIVITMPAMDSEVEGAVSQQMEMRAKLGQFMFSIGEDGMPVGKAEADTLMITTYVMADGSEVSETMESHMKMVFKDGKMYMYSDVYEGDSVEYMYQYMVMEMPDMEAIMGGMGNMGALMETVDEDVKAIIENILATKNNPANTLLERIVNFLFTRTETTDGYEFSVNYEAIPEVINFFSTATVKSAFDLAFGEGKYDAFAQWAVDSMDKTVEDVLDDLAVKVAKLGIDLEDVYDLINVVLEGMPMQEGQTEPMTVEDIVDMYSQDTIINMLLQMAQGGDEPVPTKEEAMKMVRDMLAMAGDKSIVEVFEMVFMPQTDVGGGIIDGIGGNGSATDKPMPNPDDDKFGTEEDKDTAWEEDEQEKHDKQYAPVEDESAMPMGMMIMNVLLGDISNIFGDTVIGFNTDKLGNVISMDVKLDIDYALDLAEMMGKAMAEGEGIEGDEAAMEISVVGTGSMQVIAGGEYAGEYNDLIAKIENAKSVFNFSAGTKFETQGWTAYEIAVDEEGNKYIVPSFNENNMYNYGEDPVEDVVNGQACQKYVYYNYGTTYILGKDVPFMMSNSCTGWTEYDLDVKAIHQTIYYVWKVEEKSREILKLEIAWDLMLQKYNPEEAYTNNFSFYYNQNKNIYKYGEEPHNYRIVSYDEGECDRPGHTIRVCSICGDTQKWTHQPPHTEVFEYELKPGSVSCEDGVKCTKSCSVCGQVLEVYEIKYHAMNKHFEALMGATCNNLGLRWQECACGENVSYGYWEHDKENGYSQWYDYVDGDCIFNRIDNLVAGSAPEGSTGYNKTTYRCAVTDCAYTYTVESWQVEGEEDCEVIYKTLYKFGIYNLDNYTDMKLVESVQEKHSYSTRDLGADLALGLDSVQERYCSVCGETFEKYGYAYDEFGRAVRMWYYNDKYGYIREFDDECRYIEYYMNADGTKGRENGGGTMHIEAKEWYQIYRSCSQYGVIYRGCDACETYDYQQRIAPMGHNYTYDVNAGIYFCERCGMKNTTGADGNFYLEDLSDPAGYQVGFFNRGNEEFEFHVLVDDNKVDDVEYEFHYYVVGEGAVDVKCGVVILDMKSLMKYEGKEISIVFEWYDPASGTFLPEAVTFE